MTKPSINYWSFNYMPEWEAASKEVKHLLDSMQGDFDTGLVAMNKKRGRFVISGPEKHLPLPWGAATLPFCRAYASRFDLNHIVASMSEPYLSPRLKGPRTILTASKDDPSLQRVEANLPNLREMAAVVVESLRHKDYLIQAGLDRDRVHLIYPGKPVHEYRPGEGPFSIVFATAPRAPNDFLARGVYLMLEAARLLPEVRFKLIWRNFEVDKLHRSIQERNLKNVDVVNGVVEDMDAIYASSHAVILPGLTPNSIKPAPHSALDGLSHGKPVLCSRPMSIAPIVAERRCGIVFSAEIDGLVEAVQNLMADYDAYQKNCHPVVKDTFSESVFIEKYRALYHAVLG